MVQKRSKLDRNTGNSFSSYSYRQSIKHHSSACLAKFLLNCTDEEEGELALEDISEVLDDGDLSLNDKVRDNLAEVYSLNKKKRWLIPETLDSWTMTWWHNKFYRLVLHERELSSTSPRKNLDTVAYHQNQSGVLCIKSEERHLDWDMHTYCKKWYSTFSDLWIKTQAVTLNIRDKRKEQVKRRNSFRQKSKNAVQRLQKPPPKISSEPINLQSCSLLEGSYPSGDNMPEIRYEVWRYRLHLEAKSPSGIREEKQKFKDHRKGKESTQSFVKYFYLKEEARDNRLDSDYRNTRKQQRKKKPKFQNETRNSVTPIQSHIYENFEEIYKFDRSSKCVTLADFMFGDHGNAKGNPVKLSRNRDEKFKKHMERFVNYKSKSSKLKKDIFIDTHQPEDKEKPRKLPPLVDTLSVCNMNNKSLQDYIRRFPKCCEKTKFCSPARYRIALDQDNSLGDLILWERGELLNGNTFSSQYWLKLQLYANVEREDHDHLTHLLKSSFRSLGSIVFTAQEILFMVLRIVSSHLPDFIVAKPSYSPLPFKKSLHEKVYGVSHDKLPDQGSKGRLTSIDEWQNQVKKSEVIIESFPMIPQQPVFDHCGVCFSYLLDPFGEGTKVFPCQHIFCNECWKSYCAERIRKNSLEVQCQEYTCETCLEDITVLSLAPADMCNHWLSWKEGSLTMIPEETKVPNETPRKKKNKTNGAKPGKSRKSIAEISEEPLRYPLRVHKTKKSEGSSSKAPVKLAKLKDMPSNLKKSKENLKKKS